MKIKLLCLIAGVFTCIASNAQTISLVGSTTPASDWGVDYDMATTDNISYTLNNFTLTTATDPNTTGVKFRQNHDWGTNWGSANFPMGTGTQGGANIMTQAGTYDITFNRTNGTYTFIPSGFPSIGIWGPAVNSQLGYAAPDVDMTTTDGITYTLSGFYFSSGNAYFRQDDATTNVWGSTQFPTGTAVLSGPSLFIPGNEWFVTFNRITGAYSFTYPSVGILGTALNGWNEDTNLSTSDGFNYSISNLTLTDGLVKFRKDDLWTTNWGALGFPTGTGTQNGPDIPVTAGTYNITFEKSSGNYAFSNILSTAGNAISKVTIYPNPSTAVWNLSHTKNIDSVLLFDTLGKLIKEYEPNSMQFELDGTSLHDGIYFVKVVSGLDFAVKKIIKN